TRGPTPTRAGTRPPCPQRRERRTILPPRLGPPEPATAARARVRDNPDRKYRPCRAAPCCAPATRVMHRDTAMHGRAGRVRIVCFPAASGACLRCPARCLFLPFRQPTEDA